MIKGWTTKWMDGWKRGQTQEQFIHEDTLAISLPFRYSAKVMSLAY